MLAEIITIGDEILIGRTLDSNSSWLAKQLDSIGISVKQITSVSDNKDHITEALNNAEKRADIIITSGGIGPTKDDLTKFVFCEFFDTRLVLNKEVLKDLESFFKKRGLALTDTNKTQAEVPEKAIILHNTQGTAPGFWFEENDKIYIVTPGVPFEMKEMYCKEILPRFKKQFDLPFVVHKHVHTVGIGESFLADKMKVFEKQLPDDIKLAYLPELAKVKLRLTAKGNDKKGLINAIDEQIEKLKPFISEYIYGYDEDTLEKVIGTFLREKGFTLATAESCTGGYIAHVITSVSGSSAYFKGAIVSYSDDVKINGLHVKESTLAKYGAVSKQTVTEMVAGVCRTLETDYGIAVSGIAGPSGGTKDKPVGMVWIAVGTKTNIVTKQYVFNRKRLQNIELAATTALNMLRKLMQKTYF